MKTVSGKAKDSPVTFNYQKFGTPNQVKVTNGQNCFPTRYWAAGHFEHWEKLSAAYMQEHFDVRNHGCPTCFLQCTKQSRVREGRHAGLELEGPEYETIYALGGLNCIDSLEEVAYLNDLCDRLGLDTMSAGNVSAFAVEAFQRGKTDFPIHYNEPDRVAALLRLVANRSGIGALFADGVRGAAERLGMEDIAIHVKGLEPGGFDPRVLKGMGLSYATSARGACHLRGTFYKAELSGEIAKDQIEGKAKLHIDYEDRAALFDSLILCRFFRDFILWDEIAALVQASTGMSLGRAELEALANRITQQTRLFNLPGGDRCRVGQASRSVLPGENGRGCRDQQGGTRNDGFRLQPHPIRAGSRQREGRRASIEHGFRRVYGTAVRCSRDSPRSPSLVGGYRAGRELRACCRTRRRTASILRAHSALLPSSSRATARGSQSCQRHTAKLSAKSSAGCTME